MGTRKFEKLILSSAKSKDDIVAEALAEIRKYEAKDPANDYICSVIHAYDNGDNAGDQYIVINEKLRVEYGLKSNAVASSHYSKADIKAMIDAVDAKIPLDPAKEALLKEVEAIEADIRAKEAQLPPKEKELRNLKQQKATIEQEIADLNSLIAQARAEGRSTTVLEASKAQRVADLAAKNRQISTLEGQINEIKRQIPLLKEQAKNKQTQQEAIKSPELATKDFVNELKATLTRSINTKANANAVVALTGNQTIAGNKTLSGTTTLAATVINGATQLKGAVTATGAITSSGNVTFNTGQVTFNNKAPISTVAPTVANHLATKAYIDGINTTLTGSINTKANSNAVVALTGNQTIAGVKTFSAVPISATNPTANNQVANKAYVDSVVNVKANANAVVALTGNQTIAGVKTFSSPVVVPNATANTHAVNLAQLNTKANWNAVVNLTSDQSIAGTKTFSSPVVVPNATANTHAVNLAQLNTKANQATTYNKTEVNNLVNAKANANAVVALSGNQTVAGVKTFSAVPVVASQPTNANQVANKAYVDSKLGKAYIIETYSNGMSWYRVWSDGFCEQGGVSSLISYNNSLTHVDVNFLKAFRNVNYTINVTPAYGGAENVYYSVSPNTSSAFRFSISRNTTVSFFWTARGYI
ncbi:hypothetical protein [Campylobacter devanensis]|uniref:hypothetical protein n=1 Tax=Campylobacter devanensis TaxID=3161138 RepID=UPI000A33814B|nr:hypothetical protein [Campylobacter sp. P157]